MSENGVSASVKDKPDVLDITYLKREKSSLIEKVKRVSSNLSPTDRMACASELVLYDLKRLDALSVSCERLKPLIDAVDKHLKGLEELSRNPSTVEDYLWICDTAIVWEHQLSELLNISRKVPLANAPSTLLPPLDPGDALSEKELDLRIDSLIKLVSAYRLRKEGPGWDKQSLDETDKRRAEIFLANDILDGTIDFAHRISSRSYSRLEKIWMSEVRDLLAYLECVAQGADLFDPNTMQHYFRACDDFAKRIKAFEFKAPTSDFGEAKRYLEAKYVKFENGHYKLKESLSKGDEYSIFHAKSQRIRQEKGKWDHDRFWDDKLNWHNAEKYIRQYYENIIPAVVDKYENCAREVIRAFDFSMRGPYRIINAFEMALVIYFVDKDTLKNIHFPS